MALRVLVVEDSPAQGRGLELAGAGWGWETQWVATAAGALARAAVWRPDVVLLDYYLPGPGGGAELVEKLNAAEGTQGVPVIAVTAAADDVVEKLRAAGLVVVRKPYEPADLKLLVEAAAHGRADGGGPAGG